MDWLNSGVMDEANRAIGAWQAELENTKEQYQREAVEAMMETDEYQQAQAEGDAAEMGRLIMQAKVQGMNEYNASKGAQLALESELALAAAIRDDASSNQAYWDAGYRKSQEYSKGLAAGMASALVGTGSETTTGLSVEERRYGNWRGGGDPPPRHGFHKSFHHIDSSTLPFLSTAVRLLPEALRRAEGRYSSTGSHSFRLPLPDNESVSSLIYNSDP